MRRGLLRRMTFASYPNQHRSVNSARSRIEGDRSKSEHAAMSRT
jgi:hypothetical protein